MPEFVVVAEDDSDARMAFLLANHLFEKEGPNWIAPGYLPCWINLYSNSHPPETEDSVPPPRCTKWTNLDEQRFDGSFLRSIRRDLAGQGKGFDYARAHKAKLLFVQLKASRSVDALILVRDLDADHPDQRLDSLERVRSESSGLVIVLATPLPNQEAWVLNLFDPTEDEKPKLAALRQELGFDPCHKAEELTAKDETAKRSAKRVVKELTGNSRERKERCWTNVAVLGDSGKERGEGTNLKAYLEEVRKFLLPILDPSLIHRQS
ncbi:MAG TPA: hypothetical protein VGB07_00715 [Blastocatellia bacterium]